MLNQSGKGRRAFFQFIKMNCYLFYFVDLVHFVTENHFVILLAPILCDAFLKLSALSVKLDHNYNNNNNIYRNGWSSSLLKVDDQMITGHDQWLNCPISDSFLCYTEIIFYA